MKNNDAAAIGYFRATPVKQATSSASRAMTPRPKGVEIELDDSRTPISAYTQGGRAWMKGRSADSNPHPPGELADAWLRGWTDTDNHHNPKKETA